MSYLNGLKEQHSTLKQQKENLELELSKVNEEYFAIGALLRITDKSMASATEIEQFLKKHVDPDINS